MLNLWKMFYFSFRLWDEFVENSFNGSFFWFKWFTINEITFGDASWFLSLDEDDFNVILVIGILFPLDEVML